MRLLTILLALLPMAASATDYVSESFADGIPPEFVVIKDPDATLKSGIYNSMRIYADDAWTAGQLPDGKGRAAMAPTYRADGRPALSRLIAPAITATDDAVVYWEARSLHKEIAESYRVEIREKGSESWTTLYTCPWETHAWSTHALPIGTYAGKDVEIAFVATTAGGFILAIDNVKIGTPTDAIVTYTSTTPHFVIADTQIQIGGTITSYGRDTDIRKVVLKVEDMEYASIDLPSLACGESFDVIFDADLDAGDLVHYTIVAVGDDGESLLYSDYVYASYFPRLCIIDRCSGTWCNNCPMMELTVTRLEQRYGSEIFVIEPHINDVLTDHTYWNDYLCNFCYAIPQIVPDHMTWLSTSSVGANDYLSDKLCRPTPVRVTAEAEFTDDFSQVKVEALAEFAIGLDNSDDRYRMGYMLVADFHDPTNGFYLQQLQATSYKSGQFYFMPSTIMPEMMYYTNVPFESSTATRGVARSLPASITAMSPTAHTLSLPLPAGFTGENIRLVAVVIDTATGEYLNAAVTTVNSPAGITDIEADTEVDNTIYDLTGRRVEHPTPGIYIRGGRKVLIK